MKKSSLTGVLVLLVFAVFMVSVLFVLLSGADTVQKLTNRDQRTYSHRTAVQYVAMRVHQADEAGAVRIEDGDVPTLVLTEMIEGQPYETRIYCCDGYLREMFCPAGAGLSPEFGEEILPMEAFDVQYADATLQVTFLMTDGTTETLCLYLRSEGGAAA